MRYLVVLADSAKTDADAIYDWVTSEAPHQGSIWFDELIASLATLGRFPLRCPLAREAAKARREIRCLLFGRKRNVYRILYEVDEVRLQVHVLHIRHGSRLDLDPDDIAPPV